MEMEDVEAWRLRAAFAVELPVGGEAEAAEALHLGGDLAVVFLVSVRLEDVEVSRSEDVAERSGDAEVEDEDLSSEAASVVGFLESVEAVNVETLYSGDTVGILVDVEVEDVEDVEVMCLGDAVDWHEGAEAEESVVGFPEDAEIEEDVDFESAAALQSEVSAVEILEVVEARQAFELAFGSSGCSPELDLAFFLQDSYSLPDQEKEPLLETELETGGAVDCQRVRDCDRAATLEVLEDDVEARLLRVDFDYSQESRFLQCLGLDAELALLVGEVLLHQADECCFAFAGCWG